MLSAIASTNKVAVLAPGGDSLAFVDVHTLELSSCAQPAGKFDHVLAFHNRFVAYATEAASGDADNNVGIKVATYASTGGEEEYALAPPQAPAQLVNLVPFGRDRLMAYVEMEDRCELQLWESAHASSFSSSSSVETVKTLQKREKDDAKSKPLAASHGECAVFTKGSSTVLGYRTLSNNKQGQFFTVSIKGKSKTCIEVLHSPQDKTVVCVGLESGKILVSRFLQDSTKAVTSELHWHSSAVLTLTLVNDLHLLSGGNEGTLVMWKLDEGTQSLDFRPRLGAPIVDTCLTQDGTAACALLEDGTLLQVSLPQMNLLARRIHCWTPKTTTMLVQKLDTATVAVYDHDFHLPGVIKIMSRYPQEEEEEHSVDVTQRNAVSTSARASRWKIATARFSPDGSVLACVLESQGKHEARVFLSEQECLRVTLAPPAPSGSSARAAKASSPTPASYELLLAVTDRACAIVDPNALHKLVVMHLSTSSSSSSGSAAAAAWSTQSVFDVSPQRIRAVSLSDDESCVACLCESGVVRVYDRRTGRVVLTHALPSMDAVASIAFAKHSRELYCWNASRVDALISKQSLTNVRVKFASAHALVDSVAVLMQQQQDDDRWVVRVWDAHRLITSDVVEALSRLDGGLEAFEFAGKELGWLVKTKAAGWHVTGGAAKMKKSEQQLVLGGMRRIPGLKMRTTPINEGAAGAEEEDNKRGQLSENEVPDVADWCHDLPSHLLLSPPPLQLVWPTWGKLPPSAVAQQQPAVLPRASKKARTGAKAAAAALAESSSSSSLLAEPSEQELGDFQALFNSLK